MVLSRGVTLIASGVLVGATLAGASTRALSSLLSGVSPLDGATFATTGVVILLCGLTACCVPAVRAARVDPMQAVRGDRHALK
jgi:ABC-type antimicrobial peptide transport system permease subunit